MLATMNPSPLAESLPMLDKNNIINQRDGESLYQICLKLRRRLSEVPNFRPYLDQMAQEEAEGADPVSSLWRCFRNGLPLLTIYNASQPEDGDLTVDPSNSDLKMGKQAAYRFNVACKLQMSIPASDIFSLNDLYGDNTTGFVKVTKQVNRVLDILSLSGKLYPSPESLASGDETNAAQPNGQAPKQLTRRQHILKELVETERQYVHHLLNLQALKKELEECGALTGDSIHSIFLNLNNLLDFAQRFLIRIEQHNELPEQVQNWGELFIHYKEPFRQYEPFIANQLRCEKTCQKEWDKMKKMGRSSLMDQMLADPTILSGFLLKPFQRLTKYPLLLKVGGCSSPSPDYADFYLLGSVQPSRRREIASRSRRRGRDYSGCATGSQCSD
jgi:cell division control protein 24